MGLNCSHSQLCLLSTWIVWLGWPEGSLPAWMPTLGPADTNATGATSNHRKDRQRCRRARGHRHRPFIAFKLCSSRGSLFDHTELRLSRRSHFDRIDVNDIVMEWMECDRICAIQCDRFGSSQKIKRRCRRVRGACDRRSIVLNSFHANKSHHANQM